MILIHTSERALESPSNGLSIARSHDDTSAPENFSDMIFEAFKWQFLDQKSQISEDLPFSMLWSAEFTQLCAPVESER